MDKLVNNKKAVKMILAVLAALIVLFGAVMMIVATSGDSEASEKKTEETKSAETSSDAVEETSVSRFVINDIPAYSEEVYGCRVDDINDTASVALLLETMGMEDAAGKYTVEIAPADDMKVLTVTAEAPVKTEARRTYDSNMEICAQQLLALIPEVDQVTWTYPVTGSDDKKENAAVSVDAEAASNAAGEDIRAFGESKQSFEKLVKKQMKK